MRLFKITQGKKWAHILVKGHSYCYMADLSYLKEAATCVSNNERVSNTNVVGNLCKNIGGGTTDGFVAYLKTEETVILEEFESFELETFKKENPELFI